MIFYNTFKHPKSYFTSENLEFPCKHQYWSCFNNFSKVKFQVKLALNLENTYLVKGTHESQFHDKWVPVTMVWSVLGLRMEERPPV
jgi:hypothetical protein